ncbi:hypothetical protein OQA88_7025 [Cercophora sp. LCS_1]
MRLIDTRTLAMRESVSDIPPYAILSHTWGSEEVTSQNYHKAFSLTGSNLVHMPGAGYAKIGGLCSRARQRGLGWAWIDTCCIDKTSSAELSEAINSMWNWYRHSAVCFAFLGDVEPTSTIAPSDLESDELSATYRLQFRTSRWFTRGWTLQELIAPQFVEFLARDWSEVGTKRSLVKSLVDSTGIRRCVLESPWEVASLSVAERMRWVGDRETTRQEDIAYCLFGIFGVTSPYSAARAIVPSFDSKKRS